MSIYADEIDKIYRLAKKFGNERIQSFSQVGEKYDPKKFGSTALAPSTKDLRGSRRRCILRENAKEARMSNDANRPKWAEPLSMNQLASIFKVHRNTMRKWLADQVIENEHISPRRWRIAYRELPQGLVEPMIAQQ